VSVEVVSVDASLGTEGIYAKGVQPQPEDVVDDDASALGPLGGMLGLGGKWPWFEPPEDATLGDATLAPGSSDMVDPSVVELGLLGYPGTPSLLNDWRQVESSVELVCSRATTVG
jgi:hypothetical protein